MKAVILAAGKGKRLAPLTDKMNKCELKVGAKSIIEHQLAMLRKHGVNQVILVTGHRADALKQQLGKRGIIFVHNPSYEKTNVLFSFWLAQELLTDDFIFLHGDTIFDIRILEDMLSAEGDVVLPIDLRDCDEEAMKVILDEQQVIKMSKGLAVEDADGEFIGIAKVSRKVLKDLKEIVNEFISAGEYNLFFEAALQKLIDTGRYLVTFVPTKDYFWEEIDFFDDLERARRGVNAGCRLS